LWPANISTLTLLESTATDSISGVDMSKPMTFADTRLATLDGFRVEIDPERERADVILDRPPFNIIEMPQRD
jgi:hypothetical protein